MPIALDRISKMEQNKTPSSKIWAGSGSTSKISPQNMMLAISLYQKTFIKKEISCHYKF